MTLSNNMSLDTEVVVERKLFLKVYRMIREIDRQRKSCERSRGVVFRDVQIVAMHFWATICDRNQSWVCSRSNWSPRLPHGWPRLPSEAQYSRRLKSHQVQDLIDKMEQKLKSADPEQWCVLVDGKPLRVSRFSKDPEATTGYGAGEFYRGYKLHVIWGRSRMPLAWDIQPANVAEPTVALTIIPEVPGEGYLIGDSAYDSNVLYEAADKAGRDLIAPRKKPGTGLGKGRKHHPQRLRSVEMTETNMHPLGKALLKSRSTAERQFGWLTGGCGGLQNLPTFVRRLPRVRRWIQAKLIVNALSN